MDFFDIAPGELILILIVALIVMGPAKIVKASRDLGKMMHSFRKATTDLTTQITREVDIEEREPRHHSGAENRGPATPEKKDPPHQPPPPATLT